MTTTTQCPTCNTRFKVSDEQLEAHQGLVRCGRCQSVFNAKEHLQDDKPSPQLDLIAANGQVAEPPAPAPAEPVEPTAEISVEPAAETAEEPSLAEEARYEWHDPELPVDDVTPSVPLAKAVVVEEAVSAPSIKPAKKRNPWPWVAGSALLTIVLLAQAVYFFRVEIASTQPGLKPALVSYSSLFGGAVPLPQKAELMSIESSYLEADPVQVSVITLNALLRNHATYTQAYPLLELTLTDAQDKPLARRTFRPAEYLKPENKEEQGLAANHELGIKLNLDTADLKPSGYRLLLFYPQ